MRKTLIKMIVLLSLFLAIGCTGNKPVSSNETGIPKLAVTPTGEGQLKDKLQMKCRM